MDVFWFWLAIMLLVLAIFLWPTWPYTRTRRPYTRGGGWGYAPSGTAGGLLLLLFLLFWFGLIAVWSPWTAPYWR